MLRSWLSVLGSSLLLDVEGCLISWLLVVIVYVLCFWSVVDCLLSVVGCISKAGDY